LHRLDACHVDGDTVRLVVRQMRERTVEAYFKLRVEQTCGITRKVQWLCRRGAPDRWVGWPTTKRTGWVELKKPATPAAEAHQTREHARLRSCGERVDVLATFEQVDEYVKEMSGE
jgi:hypothetical protein